MKRGRAAALMLGGTALWSLPVTGSSQQDVLNQLMFAYMGAQDPANYALALAAFDQIIKSKDGSIAERNEADVRAGKYKSSDGSSTSRTPCAVNATIAMCPPVDFSRSRMNAVAANPSISGI